MHRVLWLTEHFPPGRGGMAVSCDRIVHRLRKAGIEVDLVHLRRALAAEHVSIREGGRDFLVPAGADAPHALAGLWTRLEQENAGWSHVVAFGGTLPFAAGPAYAAWLGVPLIVLLRGNDFDTGVFAAERRSALEDAIRRAARTGCVTESQRRRTQRLFPTANAICTPNGIDTEEWQALPSDRGRAEAFRATLPQPGRCVLGLFGDLKPKKGIETLFAALSDPALHGRFHCLVAGTAPPDFLARVPAGVSATLLAPMPRSDLIPWLLACDAVALPSLYEGFPNLLLEAAALGVPVLASDAGGAGVLVDGAHGAVFRAGDARACAAALDRVAAAESSLRARWREACLVLAGEHSAARECHTYLRLLDETKSGVAARVSRLP